MNPTHLSQAIRELAPGAEYTFTDTDLDSIVWIVEPSTIPTKKAITDKVKQIEANELAEIESKAAAKTALLERLGITAEEARLLLG